MTTTFVSLEYLESTFLVWVITLSFMIHVFCITHNAPLLGIVYTYTYTFDHICVF